MSEPSIINFKLKPNGELIISCKCNKGIHEWDKICNRCCDLVLTKLIRMFEQV